MMPLEIIWAITVSWWAGDILCRVCSFFRIFGLFLSSNIVVCISIDRYVIIDDTKWRMHIYGICLPYLIKFIYSYKATKFWLAIHRKKVRWSFCKILWPSQNIWTLLALFYRLICIKVAWVVKLSKKGYKIDQEST